MTEKFVREHFNYFGGYLTYKGRFVARFKYQGKWSPMTPGIFKRALIKNYSVEEYFSRYEKGEAPIMILENDKVIVMDHKERKTYLNGKVVRTF